MPGKSSSYILQVHYAKNSNVTTSRNTPGQFPGSINRMSAAPPPILQPHIRKSVRGSTSATSNGVGGWAPPCLLPPPGAAHFIFNVECLREKQRYQPPRTIRLSKPRQQRTSKKRPWGVHPPIAPRNDKSETGCARNYLMRKNRN